ERIFVHGDRQNTKGVRTIIAGNNCGDSRKRARFRNIEANYVAVTDGTPQDASNQRISMFQVGGITCAPGNFFDAVNQGNAVAGGLFLKIGGHEFASAAAWTASMIFT